MPAEQLDLFQTLLRDFVVEQEEEYAAAHDGEDVHENMHFMTGMLLLHKFVRRARETLRENQPTAMEYIDTGFAIRFQDNSIIPFITVADIDATGGVAGAVPISNPAAAGGAGREMPPMRSWDVTGRGSK